jgi:sodium transport system ATP-binding protein
MIEVKNLSKRFRQGKKPDPAQRRDVREGDGWFNAVRDVSFHCAPGEVLGLLGPNGADRSIPTAIARPGAPNLAERRAVQQRV